MDNLSWNIGENYELKSFAFDEYQEIIAAHKKEIFDDISQYFNFQDFLDEAEKEKIATLSQNLGKPFGLALCLFKGNELAGWHMGFQDSPYTYYMGNSVILPEHRRKGLYSEMAKTVMTHTTDVGFQTIYSKHNMTNNPILIAKLKLGFMITKFELSDRNAAVLHLKYFPNKIRQKMMKYRSGEIKPDDEIRRFLSI